MDKIKHFLGTIALLMLIAIIILYAIPNNRQDLGGDYWYDKEGKRVFGPYIDVPPSAKILQYKGNYIIVEQHPNKLQEEVTYDRTYNYPCGRDNTYYWVISKKEPAFSGPILRSELDSILIKYDIKL